MIGHVEHEEVEGKLKDWSIARMISLRNNSNCCITAACTRNVLNLCQINSLKASWDCIYKNETNKVTVTLTSDLCEVVVYIYQSNFGIRTTRKHNASGYSCSLLHHYVFRLSSIHTAVWPILLNTISQEHLFRIFGRHACNCNVVFSLYLWASNSCLNKISIFMKNTFDICSFLVAIVSCV